MMTIIIIIMMMMMMIIIIIRRRTTTATTAINNPYISILLISPKGCQRADISPEEDWNISR